MEILKTDLEMRYKTMPMDDLASYLGVTKATVYRLLARNGIQLKSPRRRSKRIKVIEG